MDSLSFCVGHFGRACGLFHLDSTSCHCTCKPWYNQLPCSRLPTSRLPLDDSPQMQLLVLLSGEINFPRSHQARSGKEGVKS